MSQLNLQLVVFHLNVDPSPQSRLIPDPTETALLFLLHIYSSR